MAKNIATVIVCILLILLIGGCQNLHQTTPFLLQYKKEVRCFYAQAFNDLTCNEIAISATRESSQELKDDADKSLGGIYLTNLPYSLADIYDTRTTRNEPIRRGEPLNLIINKVHLHDNGEWLLSFPAKIAVVVTVDDGSIEEPKEVLVFYGTGIPQNVDLPMCDLIAYSTDSFNDEPVRIEVSVLALNVVSDLVAGQILSTAADLGAALNPAFTPVLSVANKVGKQLLKSHRDSIIAKLTFQVYPWKLGEPQRVSSQVGVPKVAFGHYLILQTPSKLDKDTIRSIHVDWDLSAYQYLDNNLALETAKKIKVKENETIKLWPIPLSEELKVKTLDETYIVLTVESTPLSHAGKIIDRADSVNRTAAELTRKGQLTQTLADDLNKMVDNVKSIVKRLAGEDRFWQTKLDPNAVTYLFDMLDDASLNDFDKGAVLLLSRRLLPVPTEDYFNKNKTLPANRHDKDTFLKWYQAIKSYLIYDESTGVYKCVKNSTAPVPYVCDTAPVYGSYGHKHSR